MSGAVDPDPKLRKLQQAIETVVRGKSEPVKLALVALLAEGHLLIEDVPGVGKTTLARSLAQAFACTFRRIQFTSDLLPSDFSQIESVGETIRGDLPRFCNGRDDIQTFVKLYQAIENLLDDSDCIHVDG